MRSADSRPAAASATRELYTDAEEVLFEAQRPVILNGIEEIATRSDLLDRAILINLPTIPRTQRLPEGAFWGAFYQARPAILGALLDGLVGALARISSTRLETLPRMADFARWAVAAEAGLGWEVGSVLAAYEGNRGQAHELAVDATVIGPALLALADGEGFLGTASELLVQLADVAGEKATKSPEWPRHVRALSGFSSDSRPTSARSATRLTTTAGQPRSDNGSGGCGGSNRELPASPSEPSTPSRLAYRSGCLVPKTSRVGR